MSFGSLSAQAKEALGRGASAMGTSTTTGDGGMTDEERRASETLVYQVLPSRYGMNPDDLRRADAIEVVVGQGAKPGGGGMLLGQKISERVAGMRDLPVGIDQRSACRHPDWTGPDDLEIKILELREVTDWEKPVYVKVGATRVEYDVALAVKAGADVVVVDGMQGGTAATQDVFIEHVGIPTLPATRLAVKALKELGMHRKVQLIISGGIRNGADVAKALALGADAVSIGSAALVALGDNDPAHEAEYQALGTTAGAYDDWQDGRDPAGITTQDPALAAAARPGRGRAPARQLPDRDDARAADAGPRLRQDARPQPRARGPRGAHGRGRRDGRGAARGNGLDSGQERRLLAASNGDGGMAKDLARIAKDQGIRYFLISFVDLFGVLRAKLVPAAAIGDDAEGGRGLRRLRHLARHDAGRPGHVRHARPRQPDPAPLEARGRLGRGRPLDGRQGGRGRARARS